MGKVIKFNLICDGKSVRTIEDLKKNFSVEDVLGYYKSGLLRKWLEVRGFEEQYKRLLEIKAENEIKIIKEIIKIFWSSDEKDVIEKEIEEDVYIFTYLKEKREQLEKYEKLKMKEQAVIQGYKDKFVELKMTICQNPWDIALIKATIAEMINSYKWIFELNHRELFWTFVDHSQLAVLCLLMNEETRKYFLLEENISEKIEPNQEEKYYGSIENQQALNIAKKDKKKMFEEICNIVNQTDFVDIMGSCVKRKNGSTQEMFDDIEESGTKCMIIKIGKNDIVTHYRNREEDKKYNDKQVNNQFIILDGITYRGESDKSELLYMEV